MKAGLPKFAAFLSLYFLCLPGLYAFHMALEEHHAYELIDDTNHPFQWETEPHNCDLCDLYQQYQWTSEDLQGLALIRPNGALGFGFGRI